MDTTFSFKRIGYILRADWIEYRENIPYYLLTILIAVILLMWYMSGNTRDAGMMFNFITVIILIAFYCRYVNEKIYHPGNTFFTLPGSTNEKAMVLIVEGGLFYLVYQAILWLSALGYKLTTGNWVIEWHSLYFGLPLEIIALNLLLFFVAFYFSIVFKKFALFFFWLGIWGIVKLCSMCGVNFDVKWYDTGEVEIPLNTCSYYVLICSMSVIIFILIYNKLRRVQKR